MKKNQKTRHINEIYKAAKCNWKEDRKEKIIEIYIKDEIEKELRENPESIFDLKAECNHFADVEDISTLLGLFGILIGIALPEEKISLVFGALLLCVMIIYFPVPFKKCKFVLDNIDMEEIEKMSRDEVVEKVIDCSEANKIAESIERIEEIKREWLKKKISLLDLSVVIDNLAQEIKQDSHCHQIVSYIENKILLDKNVKKSHSVTSNISMALVTILLSVNSFVLGQSDEKILSYIYMGLAALFAIGTVFIAWTIMKKNSGKYAREKTFYQIFVNGMKE